MDETGLHPEAANKDDAMEVALLLGNHVGAKIAALRVGTTGRCSLQMNDAAVTLENVVSEVIEAFRILSVTVQQADYSAGRTTFTCIMDGGQFTVRMIGETAPVSIEIVSTGPVVAPKPVINPPFFQGQPRSTLKGFFSQIGRDS